MYLPRAATNSLNPVGQFDRLKKRIAPVGTANEVNSVSNEFTFVYNVSKFAFISLAETTPPLLKVCGFVIGAAQRTTKLSSSMKTAEVRR
ncbi:MAG: hypothetical protein OHK0011_08750 [Turneriella sp.]